MSKPVVYVISYAEGSISEKTRAAAEKVLGEGQVAWIEFNAARSVGTIPEVRMFEPLPTHPSSLTNNA